MSHSPDTSLAGQVALVTGASRGIGRATALALAERGADLVLLARSAEPLESLASAVRARGRRALALPADVAEWSSVERAVQAALEQLGQIDVLLNNAALLGPLGYIWELQSGPFREMLLVNVLGPLHLARAVLPGMVERRRGVVINVSSGAARRVTVARAGYGTSKAALNHFTNVLAAEAQPFGIRVHAFYPGLVDTDMQATLQAGVGLPEAVRAEYQARAAEGQTQSPEQPAAVLAWMASPAGASWPEVLLSWSEPATRERLANAVGPTPSQPK
jgi:NAD(P)-dependent dehydrogenase (short-subunit alcohol dehydrogenase family)